MCMVCEGESSDLAPVLSGVLQGTVLSPLLLFIYDIDMPNQLSPGTMVRLFADDCLVYREVKSHQNQVTLHRDLHAL